MREIFKELKSVQSRVRTKNASLLCLIDLCFPSCLPKGENKIVDLEEELRMIGENLKALEVAEEKAQQREEEFKRQIRVLSEKWKNAESR